MTGNESRSGVVDAILQRYEDLSDAEKAVADFILTPLRARKLQARSVRSMTLAALASPTSKARSTTLWKPRSRS